MKIEYISHSCILVDTGDARVVMDPWFAGPAYCDQWRLFPKPVDIEVLDTVTHVMISHGHEDHLHPYSLSLLPKSAHVYYPYLWKAGVHTFLEEMGFAKVQEAVSYKRYYLSPTTKVTFLTTSMDTIMILESNGKVLVNLNDSLNSHHENVVRLFLAEIKKNWKEIDYLFVGLGGAGYFPNMIHHKDKNDLEVGQLREQLFVNNWCKLVQELSPDFVLPFTPGFILLDYDKMWINELKIPRETLLDYYKAHYDPDPQFTLVNLYPADQLDNGVFVKRSPYHEKLIDNSLNHLITEDYKEEIIAHNHSEMADEEMGQLVLQKLRKCIPETAAIFTPEILDQIDFAIRLEDIPDSNYFNVAYRIGKWTIFRSSELLPGRKLLLRTKSKFLNFSLDNEWGGDVFIGGYSCDVDVIEDIAIDQNLDMACIRLLTRYPVGSKTMLREPLRAVKYLWNNPVLAKLSLQQRLFMPKTLNKITYNERNRWISKSKCEICQICDIPLLSNDLGESLAKAS